MVILDWESKSKIWFWLWIVDHNPIHQIGKQSGLSNPATQSSNTLTTSKNKAKFPQIYKHSISQAHSAIRCNRSVFSRRIQGKCIPKSLMHNPRDTTSSINEMEMVKHVLWECPRSRRVWDIINTLISEHIFRSKSI